MSNLTRETILSMPVGRELDALVGKHIMQLDMVDDTLPQLPKYYLPEYERTIFRDVPLYSSDISAAWEVVEKLQKEVVFVDLFSTADSYNVIINEGDPVYAEKAPEAICKASLLAVME